MKKMIDSKHGELFNKGFLFVCKSYLVGIKKFNSSLLVAAVGGAINDRGRRGGAD
jgi:hypothetical protein